MYDEKKKPLFSEPIMPGPANPYFVPKLRRTHNSGRNDPCPCGSGRKFKHCHWGRRSR